MTTVAWDGKSLCTDSRIVAGDFVLGTANKIVYLKNGIVAALWGRLELFPLIEKWLEGGDAPVIGEDDSIGGIVIDTTNGEVMTFTEALRLWEPPTPFAGGSGWQVAMTAMKLGKTARQAIEIACALDVNSGLPVQEYKVEK